MAAGDILSIKMLTNSDADFIVQRVSVQETLSETYVIDLFAFTNMATFDGDSLIFTTVGLVFNAYGQNDATSVQVARAFHGLITHMEHLKTVTNEANQIFHFFHFQVRPILWMLKHGRDHRIFQNQSAIDIIQTILGENNVTDFVLQAENDQADSDSQDGDDENFDAQAGFGKKVREYCVQYGETHFDFISRLLEEEGIGYYFVHTESSHTLTFFDKNSSFSQIPQEMLQFSMAENTGEIFVDRVFAFGKKSQVAPNAYKAIDFNYITPNTQLLGSSSGEGFGAEVYEYPGLFNMANLGNSSGNGDDNSPSDNGPDEDGTMAVIEQVVDRRMDEIEWFTKQVKGKSSCANLAPGFTFSLSGHPIDDYNTDYAIYSVRHEIISQADDLHGLQPSGITYANSFEGFLTTTNYRPYRKTPKPRIHGSQTAFVTGSGSEVYGDPMARIKIKFHWDLRGQDDETSSLWVRVSQSLSGANWGALYMPRIGMEVVVAFIDGDPDRPLVTGCVYNQAFMPPYSPQDNPEYMTLKSKTFDDDSTEGDFGSNELRFSDKQGEEEVYLHAQHDMNTVIENNRNEEIKEGHDELKINSGNKSIHLKGDGTLYTTTIDMGDKITMLENGSMVSIVNGSVYVLATGDINFMSIGSINMTSLEGINMKTLESIEAEAMESIMSKAGVMISQNAGEMIQSAAGAVITSAAGESISMESGEFFSAVAGLEASVQAGLAASVEAGLEASVAAGLMASLQGGLMGQVQAGVLAACKGAITKLGE